MPRCRVYAFFAIEQVVPAAVPAAFLAFPRCLRRGLRRGRFLRHGDAEAISQFQGRFHRVR